MVDRGAAKQHTQAVQDEEPFDDEHIEGYYVYLFSGEVRKVSPADAMDISLDSVDFTWRGAAVACIPRSDVFSCSQGHPANPVVG